MAPDDPARTCVELAGQFEACTTEAEWVALSAELAAVRERTEALRRHGTSVACQPDHQRHVAEAVGEARTAYELAAAEKTEALERLRGAT